MKNTFFISTVMLIIVCGCFAQEPQIELKQFSLEWEKAKLDYDEGRYEEALAFFYIASAAGINEASYVIGLMYEEGKAVPKNYVKALKYYSCTAESGIFEGQMRLSLARYDGKLSSKNYKEAYKWILLAQSNTSASKDKKHSIEKITSLIEQKLNSEEIRAVQSQIKLWKAKKTTCHIPE